MNHRTATHGALIAVVTAVGHVAHDACEMELVSAVQAHEVAGGVGCIKADCAAHGFFFFVVVVNLHNLVFVLVVVNLDDFVLVNLDDFVLVNFVLVNFVLVNLDDFVLVNLDDFVLDLVLVLVAVWDGRWFFGFFRFFGVKHLQRDDLGGGEHVVFAIGGHNVDGALSVQFKQANKCATEFKRANACVAEHSLCGGLNADLAPNQMDGFLDLVDLVVFFFFFFFFLDDGGFFFFFFLDHAQDFCAR